MDENGNESSHQAVLKRFAFLSCHEDFLLIHSAASPAYNNSIVQVDLFRFGILELVEPVDAVV